MKKNIAVILFNIGGPEKLDQVESYLFNFFSDKFILPLPFFFRKILAFLISRLRSSKTKGIYSQIGGKSFSTENTENQARELENVLNKDSEYNFKTYICMSYWGQMSEQAIAKISEDHKIYNFERIIHLPLYPQFSTTSTKSSFFQINQTLNSKKFQSLKNSVKNQYICCYFDQEKFINAHSEILAKKFKEAWETFQNNKDSFNGIRILFSAHSIPEKLTYEKEKGGSGDPYQSQVEKTTSLIMKKMNEIFSTIEFDFIISYQSKIGPIKWLTPSTEDEVLRCAKEKMIPIIVPVAFVSENSETLYELDIEYKELLEENGMKYLFRCETLSLNKNFLDSLKEMVFKAICNDEQFINANDSCSQCDPKKFSACPKNLIK